MHKTWREREKKKRRWGVSTMAQRKPDWITVVFVGLIVLLVLIIILAAVYFATKKSKQQTRSTDADEEVDTDLIPTPPPSTTTTHSPIAVDNKWKIRYLKLQRTNKVDEYVQVERMFLYNEGQRLEVSAGIVSPPYGDPNYGTWEEAAKGKGTGLTHTDPSKDAFIQFDFGSDRGADRVQLVQRQDTKDWNGPRTSGVTFTALNAAGQTVFTHTIDRSYTFELNFRFPSTIPVVRMGQLAANDKYNIRYLRLERTDNTANYVQVKRMALYIKNIAYPVHTGVVDPKLDNPLTGTWQMAANDGTGIAQTNPAKNAYIEFDYGREYIADRVQLIQREDMSDWNADRTKGLTFVALDGSRQPVLVYEIERPYTFELNFRYPSLRPEVRMGVS